MFVFTILGFALSEAVAIFGLMMTFLILYGSNLTDSLMRKTCKFKAVNTTKVNFGPQHPAAHGVLRLLIELSSETIVNVQSHIGLLHRATEKLCEVRTQTQIIPYFDRLDYVSMATQEHVFALVMEKLLNIPVSTRVQNIRVLLSEITRILNHILAITTHALDVGALTPFLWLFEEREYLLGIYEELSGARMHSAYIRPGKVARDITAETMFNISSFLSRFPSRLRETNELLSNNTIFADRLKNVGVVTFNKAIAWGFSGPMLRSTGYPQDLRKTAPYDGYTDLNFDVAHEVYGDSYSRYLIRMEEMYQSVLICQQIVTNLVSGPAVNEKPSRSSMKTTMEHVISHYKSTVEDINYADNFGYVAVEAPKGEFGLTLVGNKKRRPVRIKIRSTGFYHLQALDWLTRGLQLPDLVTNIGTLDLVLGEIDR
jgi:NADH:ubiquinone oxidoreductase subunit D